MLRDLFSLFPACAGVILPLLRNLAVWLSFPRMCGGDPIYEKIQKAGEGFSPHVRG